jgi:hypothetical protein
MYDVHPKLDAAANEDNTKCDFFLTNALFEEWTLPAQEIADVWCNPPHTKTLQFITRAHYQHKKHGMNVMMIVPANTMSTEVWHKYVEGQVEYHGVEGRPRFLKHGVPSKFPSRNAYVVILWRKKE